MSGHAPWSAVRAERERLAAERGIPTEYSADKSEYEVEILRRRVQVYRNLFWQIVVLAGQDTDTDDPNGPCPPEGVYTPDVPEWAVDAVRELRADYEEALDERGSSNKTALIQRYGEGLIH